ncbi:IclR family transcriptional regulator [Gordonia sp. KTR9]|uniref:IclR family transcriptional regulator n=1 Tax=Gordonia sp. KTR9 TaxID=337191 RepID=UPI003FCDDB80
MPYFKLFLSCVPSEKSTDVGPSSIATRLGPARPKGDGVPDSGSRTVGRIAKLLEAVVLSDEPQRLVEIVSALDAPSSSVHLLLQELRKSGLVEMFSDKRYGPGPALISLAFQVVSREHIVDLAQPYMEQLMRRAGEDVYLARPDNGSMIYVNRVRSSGGLSLDIPLGSPRPLHATSVGQLYLAFSPEARARIWDAVPLTPITDRTLTSRESLEVRLAEVANRGWAWTDRENHRGVVAIAAPVWNRDGKFLAAISVSMSNPSSWSQIDEMAEFLTAACDQLSAELRGA